MMMPFSFRYNVDKVDQAYDGNYTENSMFSFKSWLSTAENSSVF